MANGQDRFQAQELYASRGPLLIGLEILRLRCSYSL